MMDQRIGSVRERDRAADSRPALRPGRTALLIVDVQNATFNAAQRDIRPEFYAAARDVVIPNLARLIAAFHGAGAEVMYTVIENFTKDGRDRSLDYKLSNFFIAKGSWEAKVLDAIAPGDDDIVLPKTSSGVFNSTNIEYLLRNIGIDTLVVTGFLTDQCVDHTVRDAADRGFYPICLPDACANTRPGTKRRSPFRRLLPDDDDGGMAGAWPALNSSARSARTARLAESPPHFDLAALVAEIGVEIDGAEPVARFRRRLQRVERLAERLRQPADARRLALGIRHRRDLQRLAQKQASCGCRRPRHGRARRARDRGSPPRRPGGTRR